MDSSLGIKIVDQHRPHIHHNQQHQQPRNNPQPNQQQQHHQQQQYQPIQHQPSSILPIADKRKSVTIRDLELFFENGHYNSSQATDDLLRAIESSQDEAIARKALDLYQRLYTRLDRPWDNVSFLYGLGLIYMHFSAYSWAVESFREALYVQPSFSKSRDIHTRLGLIFKSTGCYKLSEKHFNLAINDTRPDTGTSPRHELEYHLAHLYELQGDTKRASEAYEKLLQEKDLPRKLSANIHRQLGWIFYKNSSNDPNIKQQQIQQHTKNRKDGMFGCNQYPNMQKMDIALNYLNTSLEVDKDSSTSYYLGRCLTNIGRLQDAFASYRSVLDREESTADTWCSIGVLYHRQNQPWDAAQAYIRSVQFNKKHAVAWTNLGILYESHNQFKDAIKCYQHVLRSNSNEIDRSLQARIKYIQKYLLDIENSTGNNGKSKNNSDKLLSLEDLWNLESRKADSENLSTSNSANITTTSTLTTTATTATTTSTTKAITTTTIATNTTVNNNTNTNDNSESGMVKNHLTLETECRVTQNSNHTSSSSLSGENTESHPMDIDQKQHRISESSKQNNHVHESTTPNKIPNTNHIDENTTNLDSKSNLDSKPSNHTGETSSSSNRIQNGLSNDCKINLKSVADQKLFNPVSLDTKDISFNQALTNGTSKDSGISSNSSTYADCALVPSQNSEISSTTNILSAEQIIASCKSMARPRKIDINLLSDDEKPPCKFPRFPPYLPLSPEKLSPAPSSMFLETKKDLASRRLQDICQSNPISIVRNLATVLKLDLGLFSTKTLVENNPDQQISVVSHLSDQSNGDTSDNEVGNSWYCKRQSTVTTISRFANYQAASFRESLQRETDSKSRPTNQASREFETDSNESVSFRRTNNDFGLGPSTSSSFYNNELKNHNAAKCSESPLKRVKVETPIQKERFLRSADRIDLSDEKKWRPQLNELNKLPPFIKCISASNMLTHIGTAIPGVNTIDMSMHVPGCRVVGNKIPNNFCPVNINTGPGDYEWFAISGQYEQVLTRLCNRHGFQFHEDDWWPRAEDLQKYNVPVYRFSQRPGDLVWVNSGTFYWVQATGWANSIQWNVGPLCAIQYRLASERFEVNKFLFQKSNVPMVQLTWNIVLNMSLITDDELFISIVDVMRRSLKYCCSIKDLLEESRKKIDLSEDEPGPRCARYCCLCDVEVFNITFEKRHDLDHDEPLLHCVECAQRSEGSFSDYNIKQSFDLDYLTNIYDNFIETRRKFKVRQELLKQQQQQQQQQPQQPQQ